MQFTDKEGKPIDSIGKLIECALEAYKSQCRIEAIISAIENTESHIEILEAFKGVSEEKIYTILSCNEDILGVHRK